MKKGKNLNIWLPMLMFLLAMMCPTAAGRTIYVDDDWPADFNNIQAAINDSNDGDTVEIQAGNYTGTRNHDIEFNSLGQSSTVTFDPPLVPGGIVNLNEWLEDNMLFTGPQGFSQYDSGREMCPDNGTAYLKFTKGPVQTLNFCSVSSIPFKLVSVDLSEYSTFKIESKMITFIGHKKNGSTVTNTFTTDGVIDGPGGMSDFQTFNFSADFSDLSYVEVPTTGYAMDNVVLEQDAEYGNLVDLEIVGPNVVREVSSTQYDAIATFDSGSTLNVNISAVWWVLPSTHVTIDDNGLLTTYDIDSEASIIIYSQYSHQGVTLEETKTVSISLYSPQTFYVPSQFPTIQAAIDASIVDDVVIVSPGVYYESIDFGGKNIILRSIDPKNPNVVGNTIIACNNCIWYGTVVTFSGTESSSCVLSGFTITNGRGTYGRGGGILGNGTQAAIQYNIISENWAVSYSLPSSGFGGGIYDCDGIIQYNTITQNHASGNEGVARGGGLYRCDGIIQYNIISYNSVGGLVWPGACGGGLSDCHGTIQHNIISYNSVPRFAPGAIPVPHWPPAGWFSGGGLSRCHGTIQNNTIVENVAHSGGGLSNCTGLIRNCIIWGNKDGQIYGSGADVRYSDVEGGYSGTGNIDADPCFVSPGYWDVNRVWVDGDYHLLEDSPCIDAGDPNYIAEPNETDLDGKPRVIGGRIDMGAYEYSPAIPAEVRIVPRTINLTSRGKWITSLFWLPEDYDVADIEPNSVLLEGEIEPEWFSVDEQQQVAIVRFSRSDVQGILAPGEVELTVSGELADGTVFEGTDVIRVIDKGKKLNQPPNVTITKPQDGALFGASETIEIEANAWDIDGSIVKVEFFADGSKIGEDNDGTDGWKNNWYDHPVGSYSLTAKATDNDGAATTSPAVGITVVETPLPGQASNPNPADGATGVSPYANLNWTAGPNAVSHDVYFGTTSPGTFRGNQTATTFDPGTMATYTTYYWRIDEVNPGGTTTGTVWSFITTGGGPPR